MKYIGFSFPSSPALLKPPLYANTVEDANARRALGQENGIERGKWESKQGWLGWGRAARAPEQIKQQWRR